MSREVSENPVLEGWGDLPSECATGPGVWLHVPARVVLKVALLREQPVRYAAHFVGGRCRPCMRGSYCALCEAGVGAKTRYVFSVLDVHRMQSGVVEVGPVTAAQIQAGINEFGFARGLCFTLRKEGGVANGLIQAAVCNSVVRESDLPEGPDPAVVLRKQWSCPEAERLTPSESSFAR